MKLGVSVVVAGALVVVGGERVSKAGISVVDAVQRVQAGDARPVMQLLEFPRPHPAASASGSQMEHGQRPPAAEMPRTVAEVAGFVGFLMGAGPSMVVVEYTLALRPPHAPVRVTG